MKVTGGCRRLSEVTRLPEVTAVTGGYCRLPEVTAGYNRLPEVTVGYQRLLQVTVDYSRLLQVTSIGARRSF